MTEPDPMELVLVKITPVQPTDPTTFRASLAKLSIIAYDVTQDNTTVGAQVGQASGLEAIPDPPIILEGTATKPAAKPMFKPGDGSDPTPAPLLLIFQDYNYIPFDPSNPNNTNLNVPQSVGTALVQIKPALKRPSLNLRLEYHMDDALLQSSFEYNAGVLSVPVSTATQDYFKVQPPVTYFSMPLEPPPASTLTLPSNGSAPDFGKLVAAIDIVLSQDMSGDVSYRTPLAQRTIPLTAAQSAEIASVIAWNRALYPVPQPTQNLDQIYTTSKDKDGNEIPLSSDLTNARKQFEGDLQTYHTTNDSEAAQLANYVFAASAAIQCEAISSGLTIKPPQTYLAGITFPVETGAKSDGATVYPHASVVLQYTAAVPAAEPRFTVPAAFFYTLGAKLPTQITADQRFSAACNSTEAQLLSDIQNSIDAGSLPQAVAPIIQTNTQSSGGSVGSIPSAPVITINANQAARRLVALGSTVGTVVDLSIFTASATNGRSTPANQGSGKSGSGGSGSGGSGSGGSGSGGSGSRGSGSGSGSGGGGASGGGNSGGATTIDDLISEWLAYTDPTTVIDDKFWSTVITKFSGAYLDLLLQAITQADTTLANAIKTGMSIATASDLASKKACQWQDFFAANSGLLPPFTLPGDTKRRTDVFVQRLQKFFTVSDTVVPDPSSGGTQTTGFDMPADDTIQEFLKEYKKLFLDATFSFAALPDDADLDKTVKGVFPDDEGWQKWLKAAIETIGFLVTITSINSTDPKVAPIITSSFQFSLIECLYARGFTRIEQVQNLTFDQFQAAVAGTIAYTYALDIYHKAVPSSITKPSTHVETFVPVNPDGALVDYIPPPNLSPFGMTAYLHDLLALTLGSKTLGQLLASRRGPLQTLHPTAANVSSRLPCIDLVNESLEALGSNLAHPQGAVYDTSDIAALDKVLSISSHDATALLDAVPEYSSPAKPASPAVYDELAKCFTATDLPYSQGLDVCSSNLAVLGTTRFDTMRHFRRDITELPMDADLEPGDFQRHLWRYPVRQEIAVEYLNVTPEEQEMLFRRTQPDTKFLESVLGLKAEVLKPDFFTIKFFLEFTGLTYGEFLQLHRCHYVPFEATKSQMAGVNGARDTAFPQRTDSVDLGSLHIHFDLPATDLPFTLRKLFVFIRLWRSLCLSSSSKIGFKGLAEVCIVLELFRDKAVNPDFLRQLAALLMLRNHFNIPIEGSAVLQTPTKQYHSRPKHGSCISIWKGNRPGSADWDLAVELFLEKVQEYAKSRYKCRSREIGFRKDLKDNLHQLSVLAGFTDTDKWYTQPTSTIRFAEVLAKIYASDFTIGELILLFTAEDHAPGDDPFPMPDVLESVVSPLNLPDDDDNNIWTLREKLICEAIDEDSKREWDWCKIETTLIGMGYKPQAKNDPLTALGEHFFPCALEASGRPVSHRARRFEAVLPAADTTVSLWGTDQHGPFHYDTEGTGCLWTELPLREEAVLNKLKSTRQLNSKEIGAVQDLYFAPRSILVPFAFIFDNFPDASNRLIHNPSSKNRFEFFQQRFGLFHGRCKIIADHLASHVATSTGNKTSDHRRVAWQILRHLSADENRPQGQPWETDSGAPPVTYTWDRYLSGNSFSALLGLTGTGLLGEYEIYHASGNKKVWREVTGDLTFFGEEQNKMNVPVPTILPPLDLKLEAKRLPAIEVVNGFALRDSDECCLGGAQAFRVCWSGSLLVDASGEYTFHVGHPRPGDERPHFDGTKHQSWLVVLRRGQKSWTIINHGWDAPATPPSCSVPIVLQRGAWNIEIWFEQRKPLAAAHDAIHTGFQVKYKGPDTGDTVSVIPVGKLFHDSKHDTLAHGLDVTSTASAYLSDHYYSTIRDIRRTYQRAFKSILLVTREHLSAEYFHHDQYGESELDFLLRHPESFLGTSYYRISGPPPTFHSHRAFFDLNLLPVSDPYRKSPATDDERAWPSSKRQAALFDTWERLHDYIHLRAWARDVRSRHAWMLFYEAAEQASKADKLLRYLSISAGLATAVLTYFQDTSTDADKAKGSGFMVDTPDMADERWTIRVWRAGIWLDELKRRFWTPCMEAALPWLWAGDEPNAIIGGTSGNDNLTKFVQRSHFEQAVPALEGIEKLNNGLRLRARRALLAYLCGQDRVALPFIRGTTAKVSRDLSDLLLQDVGVEIHEKTTRIEDAISTVQSFVRRLRLGLEAGGQLTADFIETWDAKFSTFKTWKTSKRRKLYPENWIHWDELRSARKSESFRLLEQGLRGGVLTIPKPSSGLMVAGMKVPKDEPLTDLQSLEFVSLTTSDTTYGSSLLAYPEHSGQLSLIAHLPPTPPSHNSNPPAEGSTPNGSGNDGTGTTSATAATSLEQRQLPLWVKAAADMGTSFIQVAAAPRPVAVSPTGDEAQHCRTCQKIHPPKVDEFYFWLTPAKYFSSADMLNNLDIGATPPDPSCSWDPSQGKLKDLLRWDPRPIYYMSWCRAHCGQFDVNRQSDAGVAITGTGTGTPTLEFAGRKADSLLFNVNSVETFIYDMSRDYTTSLTDAVVNDVEAIPPPPPKTPTPTDTIDTSAFTTPLTAFPFFIHFEPGAPLVPISNFCTALSVASGLTSHGHYEEALKWYELAFDWPGSPLLKNNSWQQSSSSSSETPPLAVTRARAVLLEYLEALQQWGETLSGRGDAESCREALVIFNLLDKILGCHPAVVVLEDTTSGSMTIENFKPSSLSLNPRLMALYGGVAEGLAQLRQGDGPTLAPYYSPTMITPGEPVSTLHSPHRRHPYRFAYLLPKAMELAESAKSLGSALLSALERGDSEYLSTLQSTHERQLVSLSLPGKKEEVRSADWDVQALQNSISKGLNDLNYYQTLIRNGLNSGEQGFINNTQLGLAERTAAQASMAAGEGVSNIPDFYAGIAGAMGTPLEFNKVGGGSSMAQDLTFASNILNSQAESMSTIANMQLTQSTWNRRADEWSHAVDMGTIDLKALECQKLAADRKRDMALYELNSTQRQIEHAIEVSAFMRDKSSSFDTYLFLQQETALLYRQTYSLALNAAREVQAMLQYERRDPIHTAIDFVEKYDCSWENLREGLVAGDKLSLALRAMDRAYTESNVREYELTKQLSLSMHFPTAFLRLKATGATEFCVPEWMYDLDYPGMYMRRIKSVGLSIPCVVGPYTGVHARLELLGSTIRVSPALTDQSTCTSNASPSTDVRSSADAGYECQSPATDARFAHLYGTRESVATSTGLGDAGLFELSFRDERYLPFEYAGAVSKWRLELPAETNAFGLETLTDIVVSLNYTAREGGEGLRRAASEAARARLPGDGMRLFDVQHEFSDAWALLKRAIQAGLGLEGKGGGHRKTSHPLLPLMLQKNMFPFLTGRRALTVVRLQLFLQAEEPQPEGSHIRMRYHPPGHSHEEDVDEDHYDSSTREFDCVVHAERPWLYQGVIDMDVEVPSAGRKDSKGCGTLRFPEHMFDICEAYLLCQYKVHDVASGAGHKVVHGQYRVAVSGY